MREQSTCILVYPKVENSTKRYGFLQKSYRNLVGAPKSNKG